MAHCKFRQEGFAERAKVAGDKRIIGVASPDQLVCEVLAEGADQVHPFCRLPKEPGATCPIAKFSRREIDWNEANKRLTAIFAHENDSKGAHVDPL